MSATEDSSRSKENISPSSPQRQLQNPPTILSSPAQAKGGMWDSNNPMRNPPPLPLSPQMLRTSNKSNGSNGSTPNSPGKLQFANIDNTEIEHQLRKIVDTQVTLKTMVLGVDTSVKQTQLDLENLVERSSNNNSHLKNLLQNVGTVETPSVSIEEVKEVVDAAISLLSSKLSTLESLKSSVDGNLVIFSEKLDKLDSFATAESITSLQNDLCTQLKELIAASQNSDTLINFTELLNSKSASVVDLVQSTKDAVYSSISQLERSITNLGSSRTEDDTSSKNHQEVIEILESLKAQYSIEPFVKDLKAVTSSQFEKLEESSASQSRYIIDEIQKALNTSKVHEILESLALKSKDEDLLRTMDKLSNAHNESKSVTLDLQSSHGQFKESVQKSLEALQHHITKLATEPKKDDEAKKVYALDIEKRDLQLELKDKEIIELKRQVEELQKKQTLEADILRLTEEKTKLQTQYESLTEAYSNRYEEFKKLQADHQAFQAKLSQIQIDKLTSIMGNASLATLFKKEHNSRASIASRDEIHKNDKPLLSNRVLSTNSYLSNTPVGTPKGLKKYDLQPINSENEEKENVEL